MKVKVTARAYYKDSIVNIGEVINYKGKKLPSWATLVDGIESGKTDKEKDSVKDSSDISLPQNDGDEVIEGDSKVITESPEAPIERVEYLNQLICEGIDKNILIEDSDKKTVEEQIKELEEALNKGYK